MAGIDAGPGSGGAGGAGGLDGAAETGGAAGTAGSTGNDAAVPPMCSSMTYWMDGNGPTMRPGDACMSVCHDTTLTIAGTVYPTVARAAQSATVRVARASSSRPASGSAITLTTNAAGNFYSKVSVAMPYTAKVVVGGAERRMMTPQSNGNCNACHTQEGAMQAPGPDLCFRSAEFVVTIADPIT